jgi:hypothetical protein
VAIWLRRLASYQPTVHQVTLNRRDRAGNTRIINGKKADYLRSSFFA